MSNATSISNQIRDSAFQFFLGSFSNTNKNASGWIWYSTGQPVLPSIQFTWYPRQPDGSYGIEFFGTIIYLQQKLGINDYGCPGFSTNGPCDLAVCQVLIEKGKKGYSNNKYDG